MTSDVPNVDDCCSYLHPELLGIEALIQVLTQRCVKVDQLEGMNKCQLLELFYDYVLPLPQRIYGNGRRAQRLMQKSENKKRKSDEPSMCGPNKTPRSSNLDCGRSNKTNNLNSHHVDKRTADSKIHDRNDVRGLPESPVFATKTKISCSDTSCAKKSKRTPISWP